MAKTEIDGVSMYQVQWKDSDQTWEPFENVSHLTHLLSKFNHIEEDSKTVTVDEEENAYPVDAETLTLGFVDEPES